jgi:uncharacterized membrane protein YphA (DoxX/SURF4 family)
MMEKLRDTSQHAEVVLNNLAAPLKPYLSHIGRFLLVVTFLEDALRIFMQWSEQVRFMEYYRSFPRSLAHIFLFYNVTMMLTGSIMGLARFKTPVACGLLASVVVAQTLGYGLLFHPSFMLRNFSLIGGILLLLAESFTSDGKRGRVILFPGLPNITETEKSTYVSLFGRILLILLFGALGLQGTFTPLKRVFAVLACISCLMVAVGFKARYSAMFLVAILSVANIAINPWWSYGTDSAERDFLRYDFFQMLSIMGGFLLLANSGPGELSLDEKKKSY